MFCKPKNIIRKSTLFATNASIFDIFLDYYLFLFTKYLTYALIKTPSRNGEGQAR